jgi:hypothetical protein
MSPRAACRLETLGFANVYDYTAGKAEWLAYALPSGERADRPRVVQFARDDVATCSLDDAKRELKTAIVTTPDGRLVGVVRTADLPSPAA